MGRAWHGAGRELFFGALGPNNRNNGNNGVWLAAVVLVVSNRLLFKPGSLEPRPRPVARRPCIATRSAKLRRLLQEAGPISRERAARRWKHPVVRSPWKG